MKTALNRNVSPQSTASRPGTETRGESSTPNRPAPLVRTGEAALASRPGSPQGGMPPRTAGVPGRARTASVGSNASVGSDASQSSEAEMLRGAAGAVATFDMAAMRRNFRLALALINSGKPTPASDPDAGFGQGTGPGLPVRPGAVVKADGYGLGAVNVAKVLVSEGCRDFFVARIGEAVDLRKGLQAERPDIAAHVSINVLDGNLAGADPRLLIKHKITPVLNSLQQVREWNAAGVAADRTLPAILQFDTGMSRAGMGEREMEALLADLGSGKLANIKPQLIMSHLGQAGDAAVNADPTSEQQALPERYRDRTPGPTTRMQLENFNRICEHFPGVAQSIGASSTVFLGADLHKDMVRMGGTFHGQAPFDADSNPLEQVMTLHSKLAQVNDYPAGAQVGYGGRFVTPEAMPLATIPMGYADGLVRRPNANADARPHVLVGGQHRAEFVGANSMDMSSIDLSQVPPELRKPGVPVTLVGDGITPDHFGDMFGTNASEAQTKLTGRVYKEFLDPDAPSRVGEAVVPPSPHVWSDE